ncbi:GNAT family N-acetyltransferase [Ramlibacter sp. MMS24-I3-19]|uniref:GNAT family N-acetyltransferase n=1 Tax=Ramlibacter sp. MMS24-I3-19 TaxID=3416606 RepID=UPI003D064B66
MSAVPQVRRADVRIRLESPGQPDVLALIEDLDAYQKPLYPIESFHGIDLAALSKPNVLFAVARDADGVALGCGAMVLGADHGEIKRMYARPEARGLGIGRRVLAFLEGEAQARGCRLFRLETGYLQHEALRLYERCGYERRGPYGDYVDDPTSVFMEKRAA